MTAPLPRSPLAGLLAVTRTADLTLARLLLEAATDAGNRIEALGSRQGVGALVRRAQYAQVRAEVLRSVADMFQGTSELIREAAGQAGQAAAESGTYLDNFIFQSFNQRLPAGLAAAHRVQAANTVRNYFSRTANNIPLSRQVYRTRALSNGLVSAEINKSILLGESWPEMAKRVRNYIDPNVRGGVTYAAQRLARTEINNAFHTSQIGVHAEEPWLIGMRWHLSNSHPTSDECDAYAKEVHYTGGLPGVYERSEVPKKPHPQCLCYLTPEAVDEDQFVAGVLSGRYDRYIDKVLAR